MTRIEDRQRIKDRIVAGLIQNGWDGVVRQWFIGTQSDTRNLDVVTVDRAVAAYLNTLADDLADSRIDRGRGWEPVPEWWAFNHLPMDWRERAYALHLFDGSGGEVGSQSAEAPSNDQRPPHRAEEISGGAVANRPAQDS